MTLTLNDPERDVLIMALSMWLDDCYQSDDARAGDPDVEAVTAILQRLGVEYERP